MKPTTFCPEDLIFIFNQFRLIGTTPCIKYSQADAGIYGKVSNVIEVSLFKCMGLSTEQVLDPKNGFE